MLFFVWMWTDVDARETGAGWFRCEGMVAVWGLWVESNFIESEGIVWSDGSWMGRQRCAGRLGGKAEFAGV